MNGLRKFVDPTTVLGVVVLTIALAALTSILVWIGSVLASLAPADTALRYTYVQHRVGPITSWYIHFTNPTGSAIALNFSLPSKNVKDFAFEPLCPTGNGGALCESTVLKGKTLDALLIVNDPALNLTDDLMARSVRATYININDNTGVAESLPASVRADGALAGAHTAITAIAYVAPWIVVLALIVIFVAIQERRRNKGPGSNAGGTTGTTVPSTGSGAAGGGAGGSSGNPNP